MPVEQVAYVALRLVEDPFDRAAGALVAEHLAHDPLLQWAALHRLERQQRTGHAERADHLRGDPRGVGEVARRPCTRLAEEELFRGHATERDLDRGEQFGTR